MINTVRFSDVKLSVLIKPYGGKSKVWYWQICTKQILKLSMVILLNIGWEMKNKMGICWFAMMKNIEPEMGWSSGILNWIGREFSPT